MIDIQQLGKECRKLADEGKKFSLRQAHIYRAALLREDEAVCKQLNQGLKEESLDDNRRRTH